MNKKKVGIITSYLDFDKNYGGVLQAYALSKQISLLGYDAYVIPYIYEYYPIDKRANSLIWKFLRYSKAHILTSERKKLKQKKMNKMILDHVHRTLPIYRSSRMTIEDIKGVASDFDAFVCGSDQVWSTKLQKDHCDPGMFLKFVPNGVKKIAYAPSLGSTTSVSVDTALEIKDAIKDFHAISVREQTGRNLLKEVTGNEYQVVLDPTLLLTMDEWEAIATVPDNLPEKYILLYRFGNIPSNMENIKLIQKTLNIPIIELPSSQAALVDNFLKRYDIDSGKFIGLVRKATLVCTDSFHATVFSIINKTPFICFYRQEPSMKFNMNSRIEDLLCMTELSNRLVKPDEEVKIDEIFNVDFERAHENINNLRADSLDYLSNALSGE